MDIDSYNFTNNLRWCYVELFHGKKISTIKEFAELCDIPENTMGRYLIKGIFPKNPSRIKFIEQKLGKEDGYMNVLRAESDFDAQTMCWNQPNQQGRRKQHDESVEPVARVVAEGFEDVISRISEYDRDELREFLRDVRTELRGHLDRKILMECPKLYEIAYGD